MLQSLTNLSGFSAFCSGSIAAIGAWRFFRASVRRLTTKLMIFINVGLVILLITTAMATRYEFKYSKVIYFCQLVNHFVTIGVALLSSYLTHVLTHVKSPGNANAPQVEVIGPFTFLLQMLASTGITNRTWCKGHIYIAAQILYLFTATALSASFVILQPQCAKWKSIGTGLFDFSKNRESHIEGSQIKTNFLAIIDWHKNKTGMYSGIFLILAAINIGVLVKFFIKTWKARLLSDYVYKQLLLRAKNLVLFYLGCVQPLLMQEYLVWNEEYFLCDRDLGKEVMVFFVCCCGFPLFCLSELFTQNGVLLCDAVANNAAGIDECEQGGMIISSEHALPGLEITSERLPTYEEINGPPPTYESVIRDERQRQQRQQRQQHQQRQQRQQRQLRQQSCQQMVLYVPPNQIQFGE